ncbi:MAG TPA: RNA polymerase sigma factor [Longimicrobiales bacterium]
MREESDELLVRRVLAGDTRAYARLVERYRDRLARYAVRMLGDLADAEDVVQETFLRGFRSLERCRPDGFGRWLFGILVNRCRTHAAQRSRRRELVVNNEAAVANASVERAEPQEWQQAIEWALEQLSPDQREAFLLKHVEDLSYDEMEQLTGARVPALKMRVFRAREELRRLLMETVRG